MRNRGNGLFQTTSDSSPPYPSNTDVYDLADFDLDGDLDFVTGRTGTLFIRWNDGAGKFHSASSYASPQVTRAIFAADMNGDGAPDVVACDATADRTGVFLNDGVGSLLPPTYSETGDLSGVWPSAAIGDINSDGFPDVIVGNTEDSLVTVQLNTGTGELAAPTIFDTGCDVRTLYANDTDHDGDVDLLIGTGHGVQLWRNTGSGMFVGPEDIIPESVGQSILNEVTDFNEDGTIDLVFSSLGLITFYEGVGDGSFVETTQWLAGGEYSDPALGDFNGDGTPDLVYCDSNNRMDVVIAMNDCPQTCGPADISAPAAVLDLADIVAFVLAYQNQELDADFASPFGVLDFMDIDAFVTAFLAGCE